MQEWILIASADVNWGIGLQNHLLARIPEDMNFVSGKTKGKVIVMGRKTLESFPGGKPLPNRLNIVLTQNRNYTADGAVLVHSMEELLEYVGSIKGEIYVFGGESIYRQLIPYCTRAYITRIGEKFKADAFLPSFDDFKEWKLVKEEGWKKSKTGIDYQFTEYIRVTPPKAM